MVISPEDQKIVEAFLYAISLIKSQTGYGHVEIEVVKGNVSEIGVSHKIRPEKFEIPHSIRS